MFCFSWGSETSRHLFSSSWIRKNTNVGFPEKSRFSDQATNEQRVSYATTNSIKFSLPARKCQCSAACCDVCAQHEKWHAGRTLTWVWVSSPVAAHITVYVDTLVLGRKFHMWAKLLKKGFGFWEIKGKVFQFGKSGRLLVQLYYCPFKKFFDCIHGVTSQIWQPE